MRHSNGKIAYLPRPPRAGAAPGRWLADLDRLNDQLAEHERQLEETYRTLDQLCEHVRREDDPKIAAIARQMRRALDPGRLVLAKMMANLMMVRAAGKSD